MSGGMTFFFIVAVMVAVGGIIWQYVRSGDMVQRWAQDRGYTVVSSERRLLRRGPYFFSTSKNQEVYYVTVRDAAGRTRHAWVRCGSWLLGLLADQVDVRWED